MGGQTGSPSPNVGQVPPSRSSGPTGTTGPTTWAPPPNSTLAKDKVQVTSDQFVIQAAVQGHNTSGSGISTLQAQYNKDLEKYKKDLKEDLASIKPDRPGPSGHPNLSDTQKAQQEYDQDEKEGIEGTSHKANYHQQTFTDAGAGASHAGGTVGADQFPGGHGDPEFFGDQDLQKGYVKPPTISASSNISEVYNNLTPSQAAYLGWALEKTDAGKQVTLPTQDIQSWNLLSEYAKQNNHELGTGNPDSSHASQPSVDDLVASSFQTNVPTDPGKIALEALTGVFTLGLPTSVSAIIPGEAGKILGNLAGVAAGAITGAGLGGEIGAAASSAVTGGIAGSALDLAGFLRSFNNVLTSNTLSEAGASLLTEINETVPQLLHGALPDGFTLNDSTNRPGEK